MENFLLPRMPVCGKYIHVGICIFVPYVHNPRVHGRFYGRDLKKEMVILEQTMKVAIQGSQSNWKNTGYTRDLHGQ